MSSRAPFFVHDEDPPSWSIEIESHEAYSGKHGERHVGPANLLSHRRIFKGSHHVAAAGLVREHLACPTINEGSSLGIASAGLDLSHQFLNQPRMQHPKTWDCAS